MSEIKRNLRENWFNLQLKEVEENFKKTESWVYRKSPLERIHKSIQDSEKYYRHQF